MGTYLQNFRDFLSFFFQAVKKKLDLPTYFSKKLQKMMCHPGKYKTEYLWSGGATSHTFLMGKQLGLGENINWEGLTLHILCCGGNNWDGDTAQH